MENIQLKPLNIADIYSTATLDLETGKLEKTGKAQSAQPHEDIAVVGEHSFQVSDTPDVKVDQTRIPIPQHPMPLQLKVAKQDDEPKVAGLPLQDRPREDQENLARIAQELGENGNTILQALIETHAFQARITTSKKPLSEQEIQKLTTTARELDQEMRAGTLNRATLLVRANAKQFKLTSIKDMTEILRSTFKQLNQLTLDAGYAEAVNAANTHIQAKINQAEEQLVSILKTCQLQNPEKALESTSLNPGNTKELFDERDLFASIQEQTHPQAKILPREQITVQALEIFDLKRKQLELMDLKDQVCQTRQKVLGIKDKTPLIIPLEPGKTDEKNAEHALKTAGKAIKRLQHANQNQDTKALAEHREALANLFDRLAGDKDLKPENYHLPDLDILSRQVRNSLDFQTQTLQATCQQLQFAMAQPARQELLDKQLNDLRKLHHSGGTRTMQGKVALNIPAETMGLPASLGLGLSYSYTVDVPHGGGAISAANVKGMTVTLTAGNKKVCAVSVTAGRISSDAKLFPTLEGFVEHNTDKMLSALLLKRSFLFQKPKSVSYDKQQWIAITNNQLLLNRLNLMGAIKTGDELDTSDLKTVKSLYNDVKTTTHLLKGDVNVAGNTFHNGTTVSRSKTNMTLNSSIFQSLELDPSLMARQKKQYYLNATTQDPEVNPRNPYRQLQHLQREIEEAKKDNSRDRLELLGKQLYEALENLDAEVKAYTNIVNQYDVKSAHRSHIEQKIRHFFNISDTTSIEGQVLKLKQSFEGARDARNRGEYLRAVMFTHAQLKAIYDQAVEGMRELVPLYLTPEQRQAEEARLQVHQRNVQQFKDNLLNPQMKLDHKRHVQRFLAIHKHSKIITHTIENDTSFTLPGPLPAGIDLKISRKNVTQHHMHSQQVKTVTMDFSINTGNIDGLSATLHAVAGYCKDETLPIRSMVAVAQDAIVGAAGVKHLIPRSSALHFQLNFVKGADDKYHVQVLNILSEASKNIGLQQDLVTAGAGTTETTILAQFFGTKSINYPLTKCFFLRTPGQPMPAEWDQFMERNRKSARKLLANALTNGTPPNQEIREYLELVPGAKKEFQDFTDTYKEKFSDPKKVRDDEAIEVLTKLCQMLAGFETKISAKTLKNDPRQH